jgi:hypothetical protein
MERGPAEAVVVAAARGALGVDPIDHAAAASIDDWGAALDLAERHMVLPALLRLIQRTRPRLRPDDEARLREGALHLTQVSLARAGELRRVADALDAGGVGWLAVKGPVLAAMVFGGVAQRQYADLDLLVRPGALGAVAHALRPLGYAPDPALVHVLDWPVAVTVTFTRPGGPCPLDVQTSLSHRLGFALDQAGLWSRAQRVRVGGRDVPTLGLADTAHYLAVHGAQHGWERLSWILDFAAVVAAPVPWGELLTRAAGLHSRRMVLLAAAIATDLLGAPLPPALAGPVGAEPGLTASVDRVRRRLFRDDLAEARLVAGRYALQLTAWDDPAATLRHVLRVIGSPTPNDFAAARLPRFARRAYPLVRWARKARALG